MIRFSALLGVLACAGLVLFASPRLAHACSPAEPREPGPLSALEVTRVVVANAASGIACEVEGDQGTCGGYAVYREAHAVLWVDARLAPNATGPVIDEDAVYVLRDASGAVLEEKVGGTSSVFFDKAGASVCVRSGGEEVCTDVDESLELTEAERARHEEDVESECSRADADRGGCSVHGRAASGSTFALALAALLTLRRRRG